MQDAEKSNVKGKIINFFKFALFILFMISSAAPIVLLRIFADWLNALPAALRYSLSIGSFVLCIVIFYASTRIHFADGTIKDAAKKDEENLEAYEARNKKETEGYQVNRSVYAGVKRVYSQLNRVRSLFFFSIDAIMLTDAIMLFNGSENITRFISLLVFFVLIPLIIIFYNYFGRIIVISAEGIRSKSLLFDQLIKWENVKTVGVSAAPWSGKSSNNAWVYVSTRNFKGRRITVIKEKKGFIIFRFRAKMVHHIICLWEGEIDNLYNVRSWRRYLKKNGEYTGK